MLHSLLTLNKVLFYIKLTADTISNIPLSVNVPSFTIGIIVLRRGFDDLFFCFYFHRLEKMIIMNILSL